ncbi:rod shape-determining protein MreC [Helicobacter typhlonius]|uniref:rod shape-determining protein MreC n=1 Tax=Helicobacter typhlonius TaxID=76936 RepID=UPI002FE34C63
MRYKILVFGIVFFVSVLVVMELDKSVQAKILGISDYIKVSLLDSKESVIDIYDRHFNQAERIEELNAKLVDYDKLFLENQALKNDITKLRNVINKGGIVQASSNIHHARIISFTTLGKRDRVWLDTNLAEYHQNDNLENKIFGIVKDNAALGVAIVQDGRVEGFLNGNTNCNYDVYIGASRAMGIVTGSYNDNLLVEYVSNRSKIQKGDRVFTSGLDGIFFENIPVGVVESARENYGYVSVEVKPYVSVNELSYVWIIDREVTPPPPTMMSKTQEDSQEAYK